VDTFSGGFWEFRRDGNLRATYSDAGSASDAFVVTYLAADCVTG
jgi:hypothetical protein